ncbi:hypothetical protein CesoFtcFv8_013423 [Champsocephalus esox]|uniref:Uncharacterized protein n=1 Tax=Champsocephalus esox TaxID=159716 RepID=A0AAN8BUR6_9TELE|nr:hypothetical protein CesoFtcFv8_013423 [Champsocephalus esox]
MGLGRESGAPHTPTHTGRVGGGRIALSVEVSGGERVAEVTHKPHELGGVPGGGRDRLWGARIDGGSAGWVVCWGASRVGLGGG